MGFVIFMKRVIVVHAVIIASGVALQSVQKFVVCQNKDCCQRWKLKTPLPDVLHDLFGYSNVLIEITSCFSQCNKGPNLCVSKTVEGKRSDVYLNDVKDVISLITLLDAAASVNVQPKLLAAVNVFEKALSGTIVGFCRLAVFVFVRLHCIESPTTEIYSIGLFGAIWSQYENVKMDSSCCLLSPSA